MSKYLILILTISFTFLQARDWEKTHYIWNFALATSCDVMPIQDPYKHFKPIQNIGDLFAKRKPAFLPEYYFGIKPGDTVWLQSRNLPQFYQKVLPHVSAPFVLVMNDGDENFPSDIKMSNADLSELLNDERIIAVFSQNCNYQGDSPKVHPMPIGIDFHTIAYKNSSTWLMPQMTPGKQEQFLEQLIQRLPPTALRKKRAFVDFQHRDTMYNAYKEGKYPENRQQIFAQILQSGLIDYSASLLSRKDLWETKGEYAFSISPHGGGLDCHRTWEDLALGCIVVVKTSALDPLYEGLPVVIVKDWSEVNEENFTLWLEQYGDALTNPAYREKLTNAYWWSKIAAAAQPYKDMP